MGNNNIIILGIGCTLFADQGFGVTIIQTLKDRYDFPDHVELVDGGLLGVAMTGTIARAEHLIAVDAFQNGGHPGEIYRLEGQQILQRMTEKNQVQHVEFLEALAHCQVLDDPPEAVLLGMEPEDTQSAVCELSPKLRDKMDDMIACVLEELDRLSVDYRKKFKV
jgi:hydrogenase maturation protease